MKVFEVLYLLNTHINKPIIKYSKTARYIIKAYNNVCNKITQSYDINKTLTKTNIQNLNITDHMKIKLQQIITQTINPDEINEIKKNHLITNLINVAGIGTTKAKFLINLGLTSITDLKKKKFKSQLNESTIMLMKYNPCRKIPYKNIKKIEPYLTSFPNTQIVGGFRRKKPISRDIDVMIVSNNKKIINEYLIHLKKKFKETHVYVNGSNKVSLIIKISHNVYYKIDVFRCPVVNKYAMLLYSTGSKDFNIRMRNTASKMGYLLNQNGIYIKGHTKQIPIKSEKDFFTILNMKYVEPHMR
jgi:DNA polymerase/3'-5' exonuclease PolX